MLFSLLISSIVLNHTFSFQIITRKSLAISNKNYNYNLKYPTTVASCSSRRNSSYLYLLSSNDNENRETFFRHVDKSSSKMGYFGRQKIEGNFSDGINDADVPMSETEFKKSEDNNENAKESRALKPRNTKANPKQQRSSRRNPSTMEEYELRTSKLEMKQKERQQKLMKRKRDAMRRLDEKRQLAKEEAIKQKEFERERFFALKAQKEQKFKEKKSLLEKQAQERHEAILKAKKEANIKEQLRIERLEREKEARVLEKQKVAREKLKAQREAQAKLEEEKALLNQQRLHAIEMRQKRAIENIKLNEIELNKKVNFAEEFTAQQSHTVQELNNVKDDEENLKNLLQEQKEQSNKCRKQKKYVIQEINRLQFILKDTESVVEQLKAHITTIQSETDTLQEVIQKSQNAINQSNDVEKERYENVLGRASTMLSNKNKEKDKIEKDLKGALTIAKETDTQVIDAIQESNQLSQEISTLDQSVEDNTNILRNVVKAKLALQDRIKSDKIAKKKLLEEISSMDKKLNEKKMIENAHIEKGKRLLSDLDASLFEQNVVPVEDEQETIVQDIIEEKPDEAQEIIEETPPTSTPLQTSNLHASSAISYPKKLISISKTNNQTAKTSTSTKYSYKVTLQAQQEQEPKEE